MTISTQIPLDHPVKAHLGLKRHQWSQRLQFQTVARDCLEGMGISNILSVRCFLKSGTNCMPTVDPNVVNLVLRLNNINSVEIIA